MNIKVKSMTNSGGNQFIIKTPDGIYFQSYDSIVAFRDNRGRITLDEYYWDYSATTGKYRNQFLGEGIVETRKKIKRGDYALDNLNRNTEM